MDTKPWFQLIQNSLQPADFEKVYWSPFEENIVVFRRYLAISKKHRDSLDNQFRNCASATSSALLYINTWLNEIRVWLKISYDWKALHYKVRKLWSLPKCLGTRCGRKQLPCFFGWFEHAYCHSCVGWCLIFGRIRIMWYLRLIFFLSSRKTHSLLITHVAKQKS